MESSVKDSGNAPSVGTRWRLGLNPVTPQRAAGMRTEPPVSVPMAISHIPSATDTPADDDGTGPAQALHDDGVIRREYALLREHLGAGAGHFTGDIEQVFDRDDGTVKRPERN